MKYAAVSLRAGLGEGTENWKRWNFEKIFVMPFTECMCGVCVYLLVCLNICIFMYTYVYMCVCLFICMCVHVCVCHVMCVYTCV